MRRGGDRLTAGKSAAAGRLAAPRERRLEEGEPSGHIHLALGAVAPGSCWKMKNYTALIRLHYTTSDYMRLTPVQKKQKKRERERGSEGGGEEGNIHDLINYAIMWYLPRL